MNFCPKATKPDRLTGVSYSKVFWKSDVRHLSCSPRQSCFYTDARAQRAIDAEAVFGTHFPLCLGFLPNGTIGRIFVLIFTFNTMSLTSIQHITKYARRVHNYFVRWNVLRSVCLRLYIYWILVAFDTTNLTKAWKRGAVLLRSACWLGAYLKTNTCESLAIGSKQCKSCNDLVR